MKTLALTNFRRFQQFQINFEPQLTVLVARNGAGKTSVLDAIATAEGSFLTRLPGVSGINPKESDLTVLQDGSKPSFLRIAVTNDDGVSWDRTLKRDNSESTAKQIPQGKKLNELNAYVDQLIDAHNHKAEFELPIFAYYGTGRGVFDIPQKTNGYNKTFSRFEAFSGALESRANFKRFVEYFYYLVDVDNEEKAERNDLSFQLPQLQSIRAALTRLLPEFTNLRRVRPAGIVVDWLQDNGETKTLRLEQLSDGYRTTIAMVMDIAARMAQANPDMVDSLNTRGVVLIDEVDLHLHPGWQQHILTDLMRVFPNVQFIVTTHSAQVVSSVKPECIRVIDWQGDQAIVQNIGFSEGAQAQQILQDVLGLEQLRAPQLEIVTKLKRYQQLVNEDHWDSEEATSLRQALDEWGAEYEPELQRLDMDIQLKSFKRNRQASQAQ